MDNILTVPIHLKMTLTAREAAEYSNIGINKIDSMLRAPQPSLCLLRSGSKSKIACNQSKERFEDYISQKAGDLTAKR